MDAFQVNFAMILPNASHPFSESQYQKTCVASREMVPLTSYKRTYVTLNLSQAWCSEAVPVASQVPARQGSARCQAQRDAAHSSGPRLGPRGWASQKWAFISLGQACRPLRLPGGRKWPLSFVMSRAWIVCFPLLFMRLW